MKELQSFAKDSSSIMGTTMINSSKLNFGIIGLASIVNSQIHVFETTHKIHLVFLY